MAEDFLEEIYRESIIYTELQEIREWTLKGVNEIVISNIKKIYPTLGRMAQRYTNIDNEAGTFFWNLLEQLSMYKGDNVWLLDFLDKDFLPAVDKYLKLYKEIKVDDEKGMCIESSEHGFLTIFDNSHSSYFHSQTDPMVEAREQVLEFYDPKIRTYVLLGCGLGYLAYQLYSVSDGSVNIHLFIAEERMLTYGRQYGVLDWIPSENIEISVGGDILSFLKCADRADNDFYIFRPEIFMWPKEAQRTISRLYANQCTSLAFRRQYEINFFHNMASGAKAINEADFEWSGKSEKYIIVSGGPSVDDNVNWLKEQQGSIPILAVGTVFKKLLNAGIRPDMVIVMDPLSFTLEQLKGVENETVPLLISTTAYWKWASQYKGEKYLAPVLTGRCELANVYASNTQNGGWECGGTVTIMATRAALYFGATRIYLIGADFAYPNGYTHATGTNNRIKKDITKLFAVEDSFGGTVYTEEVMDMYRRRMEDLIEEENTVEFINLSRIGAKIKGCTILDN